MLSKLPTNSLNFKFCAETFAFQFFLLLHSGKKMVTQYIEIWFR